MPTSLLVETMVNRTLGDKLRVTADTSVASPGNATLNVGAGKFAVAQGAATATITNSYCRTGSIVLTQVMSNDSTLTLGNAVAGNGSFVYTGNANATADCTIGFLVVN